MKVYLFHVHRLLYLFLLMMTMLSIYVFVSQRFWFAWVDILLFGLPLMILAIFEIAHVGSIEITEDEIRFGFLRVHRIPKNQIKSFVLIGNVEMNRIHGELTYKDKGNTRRYEILKVYHFPLKKIAKEIQEWLGNEVTV